jgi:hypothetical protein
VVVLTQLWLKMAHNVKKAKDGPAWLKLLVSFAVLMMSKANGDAKDADNHWVRRAGREEIRSALQVHA